MTAAMATEAAFEGLAEPHRRELHVHCYRMLASFDAAEDAVQETFLRAWRARDTFDGSSLFRAWLYKIATNVCLDAIRRESRRVSAMHSFAEIPWLQPYPDALLDEVAPAAPADDQPDALAVKRETIELAFLATLQLLPARQRAALIARDVLDWSAIETAALLETSVPAVNSALQRARVTMSEHLPAKRSEWSAGEPNDAERALLAKFIEAHERGDAALAVSIAAQDLRVTMPPNPFLFDGLDNIGPLLANALREGEWRLVADGRQPDADRGQLPAQARRHDLPRVQVRCPAHPDGQIAEITTFGIELFPAFGLPPTL